MKRGSKKSESDEADSKKKECEDLDSDKPGSENAPGDQNGIDALQALQIIGGGIAFLAIVWLVLRNILQVI